MKFLIFRINVFISVLLFTILANTADSFWKQKRSVQKCNEYTSEVKKWWTDKKDDEDHIIPTDKLNRGFAILEEIQFPSLKDVVRIKSEMTNSFEDSYLKYLSIGTSDCPTVRLLLGKTLINTALQRQNNYLAHEIVIKLKKIIFSTKYQTYINANIDAFLIEYGMNKKLWKGSVSPDERITLLRVQIKESASNWSKEYQQLSSKVYDQVKDVKGMQTDRLISSDNVRKLQTATIKEQNESEKYFVRIKALVLELNLM